MWYQRQNSYTSYCPTLPHRRATFSLINHLFSPYSFFTTKPKFHHALAMNNMKTFIPITHENGKKTTFFIGRIVQDTLSCIPNHQSHPPDSLHSQRHSQRRLPVLRQRYQFSLPY